MADQQSVSAGESYERRRDAFAAAERREEGLSLRLSWARGAAALVFAAAALATLIHARAPGFVAPAIAALAVAAFVALALVHDRVEARARRWAELRRINEEALARIERAWDRLPEASLEGLVEGGRQVSGGAARALKRDALDLPLTRDLDLFGRASLFHLLGTAHSPPGKRALGEALLAPAPPAEITARQQAVAELAGELELRQRLELATRPFERSAADGENFLCWAESEPWLLARPWLLRLARALTAATVAALAGAFCGLVPWRAPLALVAVNIALSRSWRTRLMESFDRVGAREGEFQLYGKALEVIAGASSIFRASRLVTLAGRLGAPGAPSVPAAPSRASSSASVSAPGAPSRASSSQAVSAPGAEARIGAAAEEGTSAGSPSPMAAHLWMAQLHRTVERADARHSALLHALLEAVLLWDFHVLARLERWQRAVGRRARGWLETLGEIETLAAFAMLRHDNPEWCFPTVSPGAKQLEASDLGHPLLASGMRVGNDVTVGPAGTFLLVTGSNMAGKSTLLRALGVNTVLAQAGAPACAAALALPPLRIGTSILIEDSLASGISFFMAELLRIRQIVAEADRAGAEGQGPAYLYLLDEILRGTNSRERRIAVRRVLSHLLASGALGAVSTHDVELVEVPELAAACQPVHFRETLHPAGSGPPMTFDYKLRPGVATTGNALALLELVGLGEERSARGDAPSPPPPARSEPE